jgi:hypothetical protein
MSWVRLDDQWADHPKFTKVGDTGQLMWVKALTYACRYRTKGIVPTGAVAKLISIRNTRHVEDRLVKAGLWIPCDDGYRIHDFEKYQPISEEKRIQIAKARSKSGAKGAAARWQNDGNNDGNSDGNLPYDVPPGLPLDENGNCHDGKMAPSPSPVDPNGSTPQTPNPGGGIRLVDLAARGYAAGIRAITKQNWGFPDRREERLAMVEIISLHAPGLKGDSLEAKMTAIASTYCTATLSRAQYEGGFRPSKCLEWLNAGGSLSSGVHRVAGARRAERSAVVQLADLDKAEGKDT